MTPLQNLLATSRWAQTLDDAARLRVERDTRERIVPAGGYICRYGETPEYWIGIVDGLVKMSNISPEGKPATFAGLAAGSWFGEGTLLKNEKRRYDVVTLRESRFACMPRETFLWLLDTSIAFNRFLLMQLNERLGQFIGMVEHRLLAAEGRVARSLASLFNPILYPGTDPLLKISQEEIGYLSGLSRQSANRALHRLEEHGLLQVEYGGIRIVDLDGLRRYGD